MQIAHSWRVTKDISLGDDPRVRWGEVLENLDNAARLARFVGPGGWNDLGAPQQPEHALGMCCVSMCRWQLRACRVACGSTCACRQGTAARPSIPSCQLPGAQPSPAARACQGLGFWV